ncbi:MAG TPA: hypothetical protein VEQ60_31810, partial [Longimicrobium sp.]|nr:hypothetical protein [Longimicrobium sp.]
IVERGLQWRRAAMAAVLAQGGTERHPLVEETLASLSFAQTLRTVLAESEAGSVVGVPETQQSSPP